jgi:hypothetical protein
VNYVSTHTYDDQTASWLVPDPAEQFSNPYLAMGNNPVMYVDPDGEFAVLAALIIKKAIVVAKAAKVAKVATVAAKTAKASKFATVMGKATSTKGITTGLKSGAINTISNYDADEGLGWNTLGDFAAGFAGGSIGYGSESKLIGMGIGGLGTWAVNGASFDYSGGQEFVGGALSSYVGMGKAVKGKHALFKKGTSGKAVFKKAANNQGFLYDHGDNFFKYGFQNNAYDFAYTKEEDFRKREGGHLDLFLWGGVSGAFQAYSWTQDSYYHFGKSPLFMIADWGINSTIKKRYEGFKTDGSQSNKLVLNHFKWGLELVNFLR